MDECASDKLLDRRTALEAILEQIDRKQELADALEADVAALRDAIANLPLAAPGVKFCGAPPRAPSAGVGAEIRSLNADIASLGIDRRAHQRRLESALQNRARLQAQSAASQHRFAALQAELASGAQRLQKARTLLARLRKSRPGRGAAPDLAALLARMREVESRIADADRELEGAAAGNNGAGAIASLRSQNRALREEMASLGNRYARLQSVAAKWARRAPREGARALAAQGIGALVDALDRARVRANRSGVARGRAALESEIAQFYAEQRRLVDGVNAARVAAQESEAALVREIATLRRAVAERNLT
jgi:DNA repair exonuclease SbcCD ATPase subunit